MELCNGDCTKCTAKHYSGILTGCKIFNSIIRANEMKEEAYRAMKNYWENKEQVEEMEILIYKNTQGEQVPVELYDPVEILINGKWIELNLESLSFEKSEEDI